MLPPNHIVITSEEFRRMAAFIITRETRRHEPPLNRFKMFEALEILVPGMIFKTDLRSFWTLSLQ